MVSKSKLGEASQRSGLAKGSRAQKRIIMAKQSLKDSAGSVKKMLSSTEKILDSSNAMQLGGQKNKLQKMQNRLEKLQTRMADADALLSSVAKSQKAAMASGGRQSQGRAAITKAQERIKKLDKSAKQLRKQHKSMIAKMDVGKGALGSPAPAKADSSRKSSKSSQRPKMWIPSFTGSAPSKKASLNSRSGSKMSARSAGQKKASAGRLQRSGVNKAKAQKMGAAKRKGLGSRGASLAARKSNAKK